MLFRRIICVNIVMPITIRCRASYWNIIPSFITSTKPTNISSFITVPLCGPQLYFPSVAILLDADSLDLAQKLIVK